MKNIGIYIHIPFCMNKCLYCDFTTMPYQDKRIPKYFELLEKEIEKYFSLSNEYIINSIYIGGGTPSYVDEKYIEELMNKIRNNFLISKDCEISIECNPKTLTEEKVKKYKDIGINRVSLGVQTFSDNLLQKLGRYHSKKDVIEDIKLLRKYNLNNINLDLMFAIPDQDIHDIKNDIKMIADINPTHISWYSLIIEKNTRFHKLYTDGKLNNMEEDVEQEIYFKIINELCKLEYNHYEISNFSKTGYESRHNRKYWNCEEYIGIGLGASGYINNTRYINENRFKKYEYQIDGGKYPIKNLDKLNKKDKAFEYVIMRMRLVEGLDLNEFRVRFGYDFYEFNKQVIEEFISNKNLIKEKDNLRFTKKGIYISNNFFININIK